jgi:uncharacterized protein YciI
MHFYPQNGGNTSAPLSRKQIIDVLLDRKRRLDNFTANMAAHLADLQAQEASGAPDTTGIFVPAGKNRDEVIAAALAEKAGGGAMLAQIEHIRRQPLHLNS